MSESNLRDRLYQQICERALEHGRDSEPEHEVGDLQEAVAVLLELVPEESLSKLPQMLAERDVDGWRTAETPPDEPHPGIHAGHLQYQEGSDGPVRHLASFSVQAASAADARRKVLDEHWDSRLDAADCIPVFRFIDADQVE
jgi:hypothetical protein